MTEVEFTKDRVIFSDFYIERNKLYNLLDKMISKDNFTVVGDELLFNGPPNDFYLRVPPNFQDLGDIGCEIAYYEDNSHHSATFDGKTLKKIICEVHTKDNWVEFSQRLSDYSLRYKITESQDELRFIQPERNIYKVISQSIFLESYIDIVSNDTDKKIISDNDGNEFYLFNGTLGRHYCFVCNKEYSSFNTGFAIADSSHPLYVCTDCKISFLLEELDCYKSDDVIPLVL